MFKVVAPKKARLAEAEESLAETMKILNAKREELAEVEGKLANLKLTFAEMTDKKQQLEFQVWLVLSIRPRLYEEKLSRVEGSPAYPGYPGRVNFSYISLQNLASRLHEKQKVGSARRVTRLAGSPFCDGRVTLLAGPTFLHINTLARLAGSTPSRRDNQSMRELCCQLLARAEGSTFFSYKRSVKLTRLGG